MQTLRFFELASFSYCLVFQKERLLLDRTSNYIHSAEKIVSANNTSVGYFVPVAKLYVVKIEATIETLKKGKKALRFALDQFDKKKINKDEFYRVFCQKLEHFGEFYLHLNELNIGLERIFPPLVFASNAADAVADGVNTALIAIGETTVNAAGAVSDGVKTTLIAIGETTVDAAGAVADGVNTALIAIGETTVDAASAVSDGFNAAVDAIADTVVDSCKIN